MKKLLIVSILGTMFAVAIPAIAATSWNVTGSYDVDFEYLGSHYVHDMNLAQDSSDNLSGSGGYPAGGGYTYTWVIDSGTVAGNTVNLTAHYTASADAVTPLTTMTMTGTIASDGSISGTWHDNYQNGDRNGVWETTSGLAELQLESYVVNPWIYDPDNLGHIVSKWNYEDPSLALNKDLCKKNLWKNNYVFGINHPKNFKNQGQCVSYADNWNTNLEQVLVLQKNAPTTSNEAAGAELVGEEGITLTELGFDYKGYCGAGAPRFNVYTTAGTYYFFGCIYGTHTNLGDGWTQVRFTNADAYPADGVTAFPGFGDTVVTDIEIVFDEGTDVGSGQTMLDNIDVNGIIVGEQ